MEYSSGTGGMMSEPTRTYTNGEINVFWRSPLCTHCEACWKGLPSVFNPDGRPWVNMAGAVTQEIKRQVMECPSGALTVAMVDAE